MSHKKSTFQKYNKHKTIKKKVIFCYFYFILFLCDNDKNKVDKMKINEQQREQQQ